MVDNINMINHTSQQKTAEDPMEGMEDGQRTWGKSHKKRKTLNSKKTKTVKIKKLFPPLQ